MEIDLRVSLLVLCLPGGCGVVHTKQNTRDRKKTKKTRPLEKPEEKKHLSHSRQTGLLNILKPIKTNKFCKKKRSLINSLLSIEHDLNFFSNN